MKMNHDMRKLVLGLLIAVMLLGAVRTANTQPSITIDGVVNPGEWDAYYLGTSVTGWGGGTSVRVYGFVDDGFLYAAYVANMSQPGWELACELSVNANFYYRTPQSISWPDAGYTIFEMVNTPPTYMQTDGDDWVPIGTLPDANVEYGYTNMYDVDQNLCKLGLTSNNVAEFKIPLSVLTYAGADDKVRLSGQYWQYDGATPFYVNLPPPAPQAVKVEVLKALQDLRDGGGVSDKDRHMLDEAIKHLTKSLNPDLWVDDTHLQAKHGEKVFNEEKDAVVKLLELMKDKKSTIPDATLQVFIDQLVGADKALALVAIEAAAGGDAKKIAKANEELGKGDARALDGKFADAIEHYRNAWKRAIEAL
jgi:hypothetical protein